MRVKRSTRGAVALAAMLLSLVAFGGSAQAHARPGAADPAVITTWDAIAMRTVAVEAAKHPAVIQLYLGIMSAAVYDAVVTIEGGYAPYGGRLDVHGRRHASSQAAAATAAYRILASYFPQFAAALAADYQTSLALIPDGRAKDRGVAVGEAAAARIVLGLRQGDGRDDPSIVYSRAPAPGVWRPTPPPMLPFAVVWLGFVRPLVLSSQTQIPLHGPDPLTSRRYARDSRRSTTSERRPARHGRSSRTQNALFWSDNTPSPCQDARPGPRDPARPGHREQRHHVRGPQCVRRRCGHLLLARQVRLRLLAADHGHPRGGHRRQPGDGRRPWLDAAHRDAALPRVPSGHGC